MIDREREKWAIESYGNVSRERYSARWVQDRERQWDKWVRVTQVETDKEQKMDCLKKSKVDWVEANQSTFVITNSQKSRCTQFWSDIC